MVADGGVPGRAEGVRVGICGGLRTLNCLGAVTGFDDQADDLFEAVTRPRRGAGET